MSTRPTHNTETESSSVRSRIETPLRDAVDATVTPGAVCRVGGSGSEDVTVLMGHLASFDDSGEPIPRSLRKPVAESTLYDLASVTKVFTAITILSLVDGGVLGLDDSVAEWLPGYRTSEKVGVTLAHLLSHTSGLPPVWLGWHGQVHDEGTDHAQWMQAERSQVLDQILGLNLVRPPGHDLTYSCLGYITAMAIAERATGQRWPRLVTERVLTPLGLSETTFRPNAVRTAPTEFQPAIGRGMVHGDVHDETAFALGGASGNAGLFGPVDDVFALGHALLAGLPGILSEASFGRLWHDQLPALLGSYAPKAERKNGFGQSLGLRIGETSWMGSHAGEARGHTGFTGTSLLMDREENRVAVLLTNRVHPRRDGSDLSGVRAAIGEIVYGR